MWPDNYAALSLDGGLQGAFRILPAGQFRTSDGRPKGGFWKLTPERGQALVAEAAQRSGDYLIDYEHLSLKQGERAKPAGWFKALEWRADGLYVTDARWTDEAKRMIQAGEYRFVSPLFSFDQNSLEVLDLVSIALTNNLALQGLTDLARVAVNSAQRPAAGQVPGSLSAQEFEMRFGMPYERAAQLAAGPIGNAPPSPPGVTGGDWEKLWHVFGDALNG